MDERIYNENAPAEDPEIGAYSIMSSLARQAAEYADNVHRSTLEEIFKRNGLEIDLSPEKVFTIPQQLAELGYIMHVETQGEVHTIKLAKIVDTSKYKISIKFKFEDPKAD